MVKAVKGLGFRMVSGFDARTRTRKARLHIEGLGFVLKCLPVRVAVSEVLLQLGHLVELWIIHRLS